MAKVHDAIFEILKSLSVEKGGELPSNMGGKSYITAVDLNSEIKRKFVEHGLIILPKEEEVSKEILVGTRTTVTLSIRGTYTIIATEDGSSVDIGGVGDGLALGTAVAANIASTNALKNALLRTFLVTEQSAEDQAKEGIVEEVDDKKSTVATAKPASPMADLDALRSQIGQYITAGLVTGEDVNEIGDRISKNTKREWTVKQHESILAELAATWDLDTKTNLKTGEVK